MGKRKLPGLVGAWPWLLMIPVGASLALARPADGPGALRPAPLPMEDKAVAFVQSLDEGQRRRCLLPADDRYRSLWRFTPAERTGISLAELSASQREKLTELFAASLSEAGLILAERIRMLEDVLREMERNPGRDKEKYFATFFGRPEAGRAWAWRYEGHHLSLHFAIEGSRLVGSSPQFLGANPATVPTGPRKGERALPREQDLAFRLLGSLSEDQRSQAVLEGAAPADLLSGNLPTARRFEQSGIGYADLTEAQRAMLLDLVRVYAEVQSAPESRRRMDAAQAERSHLSFAWLGSLRPGAGHYYRVQGKSFLIEYDNTQNGANHIHSVWRDFEKDVTRDPLAEHYRAAGHHRR